MKKLINCLLATATSILFIFSCTQDNSSPASDSFFTLSMNGETHHIEMPSDSVFFQHGSGGESNIWAYDVPAAASSRWFHISYLGDTTTGTFLASMTMTLPPDTYGGELWQSGTLIITEFGPLNTYVAGSFTGKVIKDGTTDTSTFTCSFRGKRFN